MSSRNMALAFDILARDKASKNIDKVGDSAQKTGGKLGGLSSAMKGLAGAVAVGFVAKKAKDFFGTAIAGAREAIAIDRQTEAVIKSTGGAAGVTAKHIDRLSNRLQRQQVISDEVVQTGANLLLTFTNIRNEAGKGNDVFDQTVRLAGDMSVALGQDVKASALGLGKALNDPTKGVTALTRVGVSFTQQQKDQIKAMVAAGDTLGAQKVILAELENQFGGSAAAQADASKRMGLAWADFQEVIGRLLIPVVDRLLRIGTRLADWLSAVLPGAVKAARRAFDPLIDGVGKIARAFRVLGQDDGAQGFGEIMDNLLGNSGKYVGFFRDIGNSILGIRDTIQGVITVFRNAFSAGDTFGLTGADGLEGKAAVAGKAVRDFWENVLRPGFEFIKTNIKPILIGLGIAVAALVAPFVTVGVALVVAYKRFSGFRAVVDGVLRFLVSKVVPAVVKFVGHVADSFGDLVEWVQEHWDQIREAISHVVNVVAGIIRTTVDVVSALWRAWGDDLLRIAQTIWGYIHRTIENAVRVVQSIIQTVLAVINGDWGKAWDGIKGILAAVWDQIRNVVSTAINLLKSTIGGVLSTIAEIWAGIWDGIKDKTSGAIDSVVGFVTGIPGRIGRTVSSMWDGLRSGVTAAKDWVGDRIDDVVGFVTGLPRRIATAASGMWDSIGDAFVSAINFLIRAWNSLKFKLPSFGGLEIAGKTIIPGFEGPTLGVPKIRELGFKSDAGLLASLAGITGFADGVRNFAGGLALVGEEGPELAYLARGTNIMPADQTRRLLNGSGRDGGWTINGDIYVGDRRDLDALGAKFDFWSVKFSGV